MKNLTIGLFLIISLFGCGNSTAKHQDKFLAHIHENTPNPYKECMVTYIKDHWDEVWKTYNTEKTREALGETDIVNFMIEKYLSECKK
ncbi:MULTISPECIES: hypothetical protein [Acinetobacter calcoaceticus/baumannii complex]|uniref:hypothetical protein n=1 Tax=Acinetobacter calcoaceticus/baumannii complex TaxID=909768 RepID=UPI00044D4E2E|nr:MULTISPECIES: hypothetical protein [Acinetobacter calcoaceticus/baumannii complex]AJB48226.1 signal peptide protein [Acinetobacter nosocomialis]EXE76250.1 hypothetical protein J582_2608 [Acinetobacter sp. 1566109]MBJ9962578.1 hypothetical protein [Acinetobacter nosocomialis]MBR7740658.1 hypothetical protein [Acinetobacter nosocomialis]MBR7749011.1 hypothetical protein [Acinetobacter nosocomialis]